MQLRKSHHFNGIYAKWHCSFCKFKVNDDVCQVKFVGVDLLSKHVYKVKHQTYAECIWNSRQPGFVAAHHVKHNGALRLQPKTHFVEYTNFTWKPFTIVDGVSEEDMEELVWYCSRLWGVRCFPAGLIMETRDESTVWNWTTTRDRMGFSVWCVCLWACNASYV